MDGLTPAPAIEQLAREPVALELAELEYQCLVEEHQHRHAGLLRWRDWRYLGLTAALLTAATTGSAMEVVGLIPGFGGVGRTALTGVFALSLALTTAAIGFLDPKGQRDRHDQVAKQLSALRAEVRLLRRMAAGGPEEAARLIARHAQIIAEAPPVIDSHHEAAKRALASNVHYRELRAATGRRPPRSTDRDHRLAEVAARQHGEEG